LQKNVYDPSTTEAIKELVSQVGGDPSSFDGRMLVDMLHTSLKLIPDGHDTGQLKLLTRAHKEMRYAYRVFNRYRGRKKISIFGSARTPEDHPDYIAARTFSALIARHGWMAITGAGDGIMKAGHEGPKRERSFGLSIRLPFETTANEVIEGDSKLINFRYFFTRKLMFMSHADAVAVFPGGFGTQDELFETLTLMQTGKSNIVPLVLVEGEGRDYWEHWDNYVRKSLLDSGWISEEDTDFYRICHTAEEALEYVLRFYRVYHSSRYVGDDLVIRLNQPIDEAALPALSRDFERIIKNGEITTTGPLEGETDHLDLPRIAFHHNRHHFGLVRRLIDRINDLGSDDATDAEQRRPGAVG
jgi:uncharacterized protein (TIGR00730 family)